MMQWGHQIMEAEQKDLKSAPWKFEDIQAAMDRIALVRAEVWQNCQTAGDPRLDFLAHVLAHLNTQRFAAFNLIAGEEK